jgi:hypothetical protein
LNGDRVVVIQVLQRCTIGLGQRLVVVQMETLGCRLYRRPLGDGDGAVVVRAYQVKHGPNGIGMSGSQQPVGYNKVRLDEDVPSPGQVQVTGDPLEGLPDIVITVSALDERDLAHM